MRRVPEVLDCWFESGSMPFAQVHYPFENADWFEHHYPGDFIVEYIGQTRGWFYTLHVLATALFDRPAFRNCVVPRHRARRRRPRRCPRACATTPTSTRCSTRDGVGRDALVPDGVADPARRQPASSPSRASATRVRQVAAAAVERLVLLLAVRERRRARSGTCAHRLGRRARPVHAGQDRARWSSDVTAALDAYDIAGACAAASATTSTR